MRINQISVKVVEEVRAVPVGIPTAAVKIWAKRMPLMRMESSLPPCPTKMNIIDKNNPARMPRAFPAIFPGDSWSRKKSTMPIAVMLTTIIS